MHDGFSIQNVLMDLRFDNEDSLVSIPFDLSPIAVRDDLFGRKRSTP